MPKPDNNGGSWTSAELLTDVRNKVRIPAGSIDYTDAILLEEATRAIQSFAGWAMSKSADGRLLSQLSRSASFSSTYALGRECDLPWDAVGDTFDSVFWVGTNGVETKLEITTLAMQPDYDAPSASATVPWGYAIVGDRLRVYPKPTVTGTVRINYQRRLPKLIPYLTPANTDGNLTSFLATTTDIQFNHHSSAVYYTPVVGDRVDIIQSAFPYRYMIENALITNYNAGTRTITSTSYTSTTAPTTASADYIPMTIALSGTSPYVKLPLEFKAALTNKIAAQILSDIGDMEGAQAKELAAETELGRVFDMLNPRAQTSRPKVVNPYSLMRRGLRGWR